MLLVLHRNALVAVSNILRISWVLEHYWEVVQTIEPSYHSYIQKKVHIQPLPTEISGQISYKKLQ